MTLYEFTAQLIRNIKGDLPLHVDALAPHHDPHYDYIAVAVCVFIQTFEAMDPNFDKQAFLDLCGLVAH